MVNCKSVYWKAKSLNRIIDSECGVCPFSLSFMKAGLLREMPSDF